MIPGHCDVTSTILRGNNARVPHSHYVCWGTRKMHDQDNLLFHPEGLPQLPVMSQWHGITFKILPGFPSEFISKAARQLNGNSGYGG